LIQATFVAEDHKKNPLDKRLAFPKDITYVFVCVAYDILTWHADVGNIRTDAHLDFLTDLHTFFFDHVEKKTEKLINKKDEYDAFIHCEKKAQFVYIVAITVPEIGQMAEDYAEYNKKLRERILELNRERSEENEGLADKKKRPHTFFLLDWALKVAGHEDVEEMTTVEGRTRVLMEAMHEQYGVIYA